MSLWLLSCTITGPWGRGCSRAVLALPGEVHGILGAPVEVTRNITAWGPREYFLAQKQEKYDVTIIPT